jgi:nitroimidazol reductase NimA-like FMN-containing flavoprotein (pyridoxamine 5'-phosphate oxidase superfamily)
MASTEKLETYLAEPRNVIVVGVGVDGRPRATPNWFLWGGERFFISTTRTRAKYKIFTRDPRVELVIDDATGFRCVLVAGLVDILEDLEAELERFRAIREKHDVVVPDDAAHLKSLQDDQRVLLAITPEGSMESWTAWGFD